MFLFHSEGMQKINSSLKCSSAPRMWLCISDSAPASDSTYEIRDLPPAAYSLWVTASTAQGEGPEGQKIKFFIQGEFYLKTMARHLFGRGWDGYGVFPPVWFFMMAVIV